MPGPRRPSSITPMSDDEILGSIRRMVDEEHELRRARQAAGPDGDPGRRRIEELEVSLDRCWDLLRQRRARTEFHQDPEAARERPADVVERYWS
jgi:hypothetical protein